MGGLKNILLTYFIINTAFAVSPFIITKLMWIITNNKISKMKISKWKYCTNIINENNELEYCYSKKKIDDFLSKYYYFKPKNVYFPIQMLFTPFIL